MNADLNPHPTRGIRKSRHGWQALRRAGVLIGMMALAAGLPVGHTTRATAQTAPRQIARFGAQAYRLPNFIAAITYIPDLDGFAVLCNNDQKLRFCAAKTGDVRDLCQLSAPAYSISQRMSRMSFWSVAHKLLLIQRTGGIDAIDVERQKIVWSKSLSLLPNQSLIIFAPGGQQWAYVEKPDKPVKFFSCQTGEELSAWSITPEVLLTGAFSPDGRYFTLTTRNSQGLRTWDTQEKKQLPPILESKNNFYQVAYHPTKPWLAVTHNNQSAVIYDLETKAELQTAQPGMAIRHLMFSEDGRYLILTAYNSTLTLWDVEQKKDAGKLINHIYTPSFCLPELVPEGKLFLGTGCVIQGWTLADLKPVGEHLTGHLLPITHLSISPDGNYMASMSGDGYFCVWRAATGECLYRTRGDGGSSTVVFSANSERLYWRKKLQILEEIALDQFAAAAPVGNNVDQLAKPGRELQAPAQIGSFGLAADGQRLLAVIQAAAPVQYLMWDLNSPQVTPEKVWALGEQPGEVNVLGLSQNLRLGSQLCKAGNAEATGLRFRLDIKDLETGQFLWSGQRGDNTPAELHNVNSMGGFFADQDRLLLDVRLEGLNVREIHNGGKTAYVIPWTNMAQAGRLLGLTPDHTELVWPDAQGRLHVHDLLHHRELAVVSLDQQPPIKITACRAQGLNVVCAYADGTAANWQIPDNALAEIAPPPPQLPEERESWWRDLGGADSTKAFLALNRLAAYPDTTVPLVAAKLEFGELDQTLPNRVDQLVQQLDAPEFVIRERATREIESLGEPAEVYIEAALKEAKSLEVKARLEILLREARKSATLLNPAEMQTYRAIWLLERINTLEAREQLKRIASDSATPKLRELAKKSLNVLGIADPK
ncbi:MAG: WD40 repeat domain-containing protein [Pirellulales bacterium]|nr:WD40 repeat domain-containing protein [Pirellulales bacterium]